MLAFAIQNSQILMFSKTTFQKKGKCGYYMRFRSFSFLEKKPLDLICALQKGICLPIAFLSD